MFSGIVIVGRRDAVVDASDLAAAVVSDGIGCSCCAQPSVDGAVLCTRCESGYPGLIGAVA